MSENTRGRARFKAFLTNSKTFWVAMAILLLLLALSIAVLAVRLHSYSKTDDHSLSLKTNMDKSLDVFSVEYRNDTGAIVVKGSNGEKLIAPGMEVEYTLRLRNTDTIALNCIFTPEINQISQYKLPIEIRLLDPDDEYVIGSAKEWVPIDKVETVKSRITIPAGKTAEYTFQWRWIYESGNDEYDTFLGNAGLSQKIGVDVSFAVHTEANLSLDENGNVADAKSPENIWLITLIAILLLTAIILLILYARYRIRHTRIPTASVMPNAGTNFVPNTSSAVEALFPSLQGERRMNVKTASVSIGALNAQFKSGETVNLAKLKEKNLVPADTTHLSVTARQGDRLDKALTVEAQGVSEAARKSILAAGGRVVITKG
ncbi:MAG: uL15 family ribosomal protein [Clostridia bacterium]|nr:uL15 family ribosomal protein [Clostridia bacterium]